MSSVVVSVNFTIFSKHVLFDFLSRKMLYLLELFFCHEVVLTTVNFTLSGPSGGITDAQFKKIRILIDQHVDESALSFFKTTFPTPEHPVITKGLCLMISL